jgi:hypothetical protein
MPWISRRATRYARAWLRGPVDFLEKEVVLDRQDTSVPATVVRPAGARGDLPAWIVLHGMTPTGRSHEQLTRFTRALMSSGAVVIVPEVPEWRALRLAPHVANPTVRAALRGLRAGSWAANRPVGVVGFSFSAPHAIATAADPELAGDIAGVVGFGGYCDLDSTMRFLMSGAKRDPRDAARVAPDPYGRWIVGANYLPAVPGIAGGREVAAALARLAIHVGGFTIPSWDVTYRPIIAELRGGLPPEHRYLFDLFAPPTGAVPDVRATDELAARLADAARAVDPALDPVDSLGRVRRPVHILHGRDDRLIDRAEAPKLRDALPPDTWSRVTITRLFGHSSQVPLPLLRALHEVPRFSSALSAVLDVPWEPLAERRWPDRRLQDGGRPLS